MKKLISFVLFSILVAIVAADNEQPLGVEVIDDIEQYRAENPNVEVIPLATKLYPDSTKVYKLGKRVRGDYLVGQKSENVVFDVPTSYQFGLWYPKDQGYSEYIVSYVEISVDQSSNYGNAYITEGGIGQRRVKIILEAQQTRYIRYNMVVYGFPFY